MMLENRTEAWRSPVMEAATKGRWHAIYRTADNIDFCREDAPSIVTTYEQAVLWAHRLFAVAANRLARDRVRSFVIDRW
jgi:hypothetical protein